MTLNDSNRRIVVTGASAVTSAGVGIDRLVAALERNERHLKLRDGFPIAEIEDFDAKQYVRPRKALKVMCREIQTAFAASMMAANQAGIVSEDGELNHCLDPHRLATAFGSEMLYHPADLAEAMRIGINASGEGEVIDMEAFGRDGIKKVTPLWLLKNLPNMPACHVGISLGALGPNNTLVTGDVSGVDALAEAISYIDRQIADVAVVSAAGTRINETRFTYRCDSPVPQMNRPLQEIGVPGDPASTGVILGEGSASVIIETEASADRRDANVLARVVSVAQRFSPSEALSMPHRSAALDCSFARANRQSIRSSIAAVLSEMDGQHVEFIVSHQSGDPIGDREEASACAEFGQLANAKLIHPIRAIGHTGAASGLTSVAAAASLIHKNGGSSSQPRHALAICYTAEGSATAVLLSSV